MNAHSVNVTKPHWYQRVIGSCPVCGRNQGSMERVAGVKPAKKEDLVYYLTDAEAYCFGGCGWV